MDNGMYVVRDAAADNYLAPFMAVNDAVAVRQFAAAFMDHAGIMANNPGDFDLYRIGHFNQSVGELTPEDRIVIARGTDYV